MARMGMALPISGIGAIRGFDFQDAGAPGFPWLRLRRAVAGELAEHVDELLQLLFV